MTSRGWAGLDGWSDTTDDDWLIDHADAFGCGWLLTLVVGVVFWAGVVWAAVKWW